MWVKGKCPSPVCSPSPGSTIGREVGQAGLEVGPTTGVCPPLPHTRRGIRAAAFPGVELFRGRAWECVVEQGLLGNCWPAGRPFVAQCFNDFQKYRYRSES